jgi:hypothetical protein
MSVIGNLSAALEQDLRRRRVLGVQFREHLLDQMLVAVARIGRVSYRTTTALAIVTTSCLTEPEGSRNSPGRP